MAGQSPGRGRAVNSVWRGGAAAAAAAAGWQSWTGGSGRDARRAENPKTRTDKVTRQPSEEKKVLLIRLEKIDIRTHRNIKRFFIIIIIIKKKIPTMFVKIPYIYIPYSKVYIQTCKRRGSPIQRPQRPEWVMAASRNKCHDRKANSKKSWNSDARYFFKYIPDPRHRAAVPGTNEEHASPSASAAVVS